MSVVVQRLLQTTERVMWGADLGAAPGDADSVYDAHSDAQLGDDERMTSGITMKASRFQVPPARVPWRCVRHHDTRGVATGKGYCGRAQHH